MPRTIFYSWQSDRPNAVTRGFIEEALRRASRKLTDSPTVEESPRIEQGVVGESGSPEIAATILARIDVCSIFVADITFVGAVAQPASRMFAPKRWFARRTPSKAEKLLPNGNVLLELGYAAARLGWGRVIGVMNEHYGPASNQIFDLSNRRWPVQFTLAPGENKADVRALLVEQLETALVTCSEAEHAQAISTAERFDVLCLAFARAFGQYPGFSAPDPATMTMGGLLTTANYNHVIPRLLDLKVVKCLFDSQNDRYSYNWTHLGNLVLRHLRYDKQPGA